MLRSLLVMLLALAIACGGRGEKPAPGTAKPVAQAAAPAESKPVDVGSQMPAYAAQYLDGKTFDIKDQRGKVVFLNLWATWCGPCRFEIPELQKLHDSYAARGFAVVGVSVDEGDIKVVRDFVAEQKMTYPVVQDSAGSLAVLLDTSILPTSLILDRSGRVVWKKLGMVTSADAEMVRVIEKALAQEG
ncbi:MAG: TlpA family protein disulfide reductase [Thermoanaerobaculia bacterium]|nr:TlpA family protein disulfide reductase [Thermoanaerobaculia bacterium]